jgi:hypothetical protein
MNILEAAPSSRSVKTKKWGDLDVNGISLEGVVSLLRDHPELIDLFKGSKTEFTFKDILDKGLDLVSAVCAAGLGCPGNKEAIERCKQLSPQDLMDVGQAIMEESFPAGVANFIQRLTGLLNMEGLADATVSLETTKKNLQKNVQKQKEAA